MASVDDILGPAPVATVDSILGPAPQNAGPSVPLPSDWVPPHNNPVMDQMVDRSPVGRVLDAFGQGFKRNFGSQPVLSPETEKAMADAKVDGGILSTARRAFNEVLFRPAATTLDGVLRGTGALPGAAGRAFGQVLNETGVTWLTGNTEEDSRNDWENMANAGAMVLGLATELGVVARPAGVKTPFVPPPVPPAPALVVARKLPDGTVRYGKPGQIHVEILDPLEYGVDPWRNGFAKPGGEFMSREEAKKFVAANERDRLPPAQGPDDYALHGPDELGAHDYFNPPELPARPIIEPPPKTMATDEGLREPHTKFGPEVSNPVLDKAGNINLKRINAPEDVKNVIRQAAEESGGFIDARRGTMSLAETELLAEASGISTETLMKRKVGQAFNAEEAVHLRNAMTQSATEVRDLAAKAVGGAETDLMAFQEAMTRHTAIQEQVAGMTAEAGRALSSFRIMAKGEDGLAEALKRLGGREFTEDMARKINDLDSPAKVSKFLMDSRKATTGDMLIEAWINGLLSGPTTHMVNAISNVTTALWNIPETAIAAGIGKMRGAPLGERVMFGEAGEELFGIVQGSKEGLLAAVKAYTDEVVDGGQKVELMRKGAIPSKTFNIGGRQIEVGGKQVRIPGRLLAASDEYFKAIGSRQALNRLAYRKASAEGLKGEAHAARMTDLINNPTDAMMKAAREKAEYQTFTNPLGEVGSALQKLQQSNKFARMVLTFVRTPVNIAKYSVRDRTVLGLFSKEIRDNLASKDPIVRDTTLARLSLGTALGVTAVSLAAQGLITGGGPSDPKERAALYATGWQPYSVRIGDMYYAYGRIEPLATLLGLPADMYDKAGGVENLDEAVGLVVASLATNLASKTSLTGMTDLVQAIEDPDRYGARYLQKLGATAIPNVMAQTARMNDPYMRDARTFVDQLKVRVPGLSETVAPRLDIWGQPIEAQGMPGAATGIFQSRMENDPVNRELIALEVFPAKPLRKIRGGELDAAQYEEYQMVAGRLAKTQLDAMVASDGWGSMPAFARKEVIENTVRNSRQTAAGLMQMRHPDLIRRGVQARIDQIRGVAKTQTLP